MRRLFAASLTLAFFMSAVPTQATTTGKLTRSRRAAAWNRWWNARWNKRFLIRWRAEHPAVTPTSQAIASWYYDGGTTASGFHAYYGVATCGNQTSVCYPFGTKIRFFHEGRSVLATVDDHGPYANGAAFDLNQNTAQALGFSGVAAVGYRVGG